MAEKKAKLKENPSSQDKVRVQFDFSRESLGKLDEIVDVLGASTRAEVIRRALSLFTYALSANKTGSTLVIRDPDGKESIMLPF